MNKLGNILKKHWVVIALILIIVLGAFLRAYNFHDWLRFSVDQPRDARIVGDAVEGKSPLPLLGPKADTTTFHLGSAYYQMSYVSAKIFGNAPDKMAYPALFLGILSIILFFVFLREYFSERTSLLVTSVMSVSYFMILSSRFSSNPNLIPFFLLLYLYSFLKILNAGEKKNMIWIWSIFIGIGLGICVQLHTTLLVIMPIVTLFVLAYLLWKNPSRTWKIASMIIFISLVLNAGQIKYELGNNWSNTKSFMSGLNANSDTSPVKSVLLIAACQIQANSSIVSSINSPLQLNEDSKNVDCENVFIHPTHAKFDDRAYYAIIGFGILFSLIGYALLIGKFLKEKDFRRKNFLGLILIFNAVSFVILVPVAEMMKTGYFIILFFIPFILLGLILEASEGWKWKKTGIVAGFILVLAFVSFSLIKDYDSAKGYASGKENNSKGSILGEIESMSRFIEFSLEGKQKMYFSGDNDLYLRYYRPISYFLDRDGVDSILLKPTLKAVYQFEPEKELNAGVPIFYIQKRRSHETQVGQVVKGHEVLKVENFSSQAILIMKN